ncbi:ABC transporter permease [Shewanella eurypsychrophilus]|uniref:ABC transporter permease n=1 Tax=Shewanella eurypsychrophilus TaxID=2593656 RepID=A0ABX6V2L8_9GAMM|nr:MULTISPECIES: ABC transporter permease [Shewanella]QFU21326.1 FtsX-like permease family protein [Shewanella sp. YLB-09]QPG56616.1 ABC transporter permease [Shewanella eurypsychrophilus]
MSNNLIRISWLCLKIFIAHYRQAPLQAGAIGIGIILAVTLLTGVRATNENAIQSYSSATELLSQQARWTITPPTGSRLIDEAVYFSIRDAGFNQSLPVLQGIATSQDGKRWRIQGSDLIAALTAFKPQKSDNQTSKSGLFSTPIPLADILSGAPIVLASQAQAKRIAQGGELILSGVNVKVIALDDTSQLGSEILMDISLAQRILNQPNQLSYIALFSDILSQQTQLEQLLNSQANLVESDNGDGLTALTESFHLNLTAMSLLAFVVGLFIAYNGVRYSLLKRQRLMTQLQQQGVAKAPLMLALSIELLLLVIIGSIIGFILGLQLSHWLQPMISVTLEQLYGAKIFPGNWHWSWLLQAIGLTFFAAIAACTSLFIQLIKQPLASNSGQMALQRGAKSVHKFQLAIAIVLASIAAALIPLSQDYRYTMVLLGLIIIAIPLTLPWCLSVLVSLLLKLIPKGLLHYQVTETKELISPLSLAMMAMLLALTANISMNTLVGSFESTLKNWLDARLHAELYIRPASTQMDKVVTFLTQHKDVDAIYKQWYISSKQAHLPVNIVTRDKQSLKETTVFKETVDNMWPEFFANRLVLISEPLAIKLNLNLGDEIELTALANSRFTVGGVFFDYGNPYGEILISPATWQANGLPETPLSLAIDVNGESSKLQQALQQAFSIPDAMIFSQQKIKQQAIIMFKRTFSITQVLNTLTLLVAAIGLFSACFMLTQARMAPMARLYAMGVNRRQLTSLVFGQMLIIVLFTCLVALPTGAILGYLLINKVTLQAFGWSIAMQWDWLAYGRVVALALISSLLAVAFPLYLQTKRPLISSLQREVI